MDEAVARGSRDMRKTTLKHLKKFLHYDPSTGNFVWLVSRPHFPAGSLVKGYLLKGYRILHFDERNYRFHRLAWFYMTGAWPKQDIDHKNGVRDDNRWSNLREVSRSENMQNINRARSDSWLGILGVTQVPSGRFKSRIAIEGKVHRLGTFPTVDEAHQAYINAKRVLHPASIRFLRGKPL